MQIFLRTDAPLARPAFATAAILVAMWSWNEFYFANGFIQSAANQTVGAEEPDVREQRLHLADGARSWPAGCSTAAPMIIFYVLLQRRFVQGLAEGGLKG